MSKRGALTTTLQSQEKDPMMFLIYYFAGHKCNILGPQKGLVEVAV
jgi:hypothetical protein